MARRRSRIWMLAIALAAGVWICGRSSDPRVDVTVHVKLAPGAGDAWASGLEGVTVAGAAPLFSRPPFELARDRVVAIAQTGLPMPDLRAWRRVRLAGSRRTVDAALDALRARPEVVSAFVAPRAELPVIEDDHGDAAAPSCPVKTPRYERHQGYLGPAPAGIDAPSAWSLPGGRGQGTWFADIEGAWNGAHEDLPGGRIRAIGRPVRGRLSEAHGTAVLGEIAGRDNGLGMLGIAPDVERIVTASIADLSPAEAIDRAQAELRPGDVLLVELHAHGPRRRFLPMEYWDDVFDAIRIATARGVVVVEAAGNGAEDLDHPAYDGKLDRRRRDSGAIMVGAGAPAVAGWVDRSRLDFSNYGSRVDLQGWGRMVATLDYGDLQGCSANGRKYTGRFSGTSSASPVVAGAALLVQSVVRTATGRPLTPIRLRELLVETGSPQTDGPHGPASQHIGPRPDLRRALERLRP